MALVFVVVATSDLTSAGTALGPLRPWAVDRVTALLLVMPLGWRWALRPALVAKVIPGIAALPMWTLVVVAIAL